MRKSCSICGKEIVGVPFFINENDKSANKVCSAKCMESYIDARKKKEEGSFLFKEICRIYHVSSPTPRMFMELKRIREKEGLSDNNIANVLHYIYDVIGENPSYQSLYMVPQYVEQAKAYYMKLKQRENNNKVPKVEVIARDLKPNYGGVQKKKVLLNPEDV